MGISDLCGKYKINDVTWKVAIEMLLQHLFLEDLFPKCDGSPQDVVAKILKDVGLNAKDSDGSIYATVSVSFTFCSYIYLAVHELNHF